MGNPAFPQGGEVGSGDVPAGKGDAKKEQKKKKKEREEYLKNRKEEMVHTTFSGFINEANAKNARKSLGYVAFLEEMSDLNNRDIQKAYDAAIEVLQDKGMSEKQALGFLNSPHGKYMGEYLTPGMDYSHEAFLDKLEEYYNERMLKQYAKDYVGLAKVTEGFFSRLNGKETTREEQEIDKMIDQIQNTDVQGLFDKAIDNLDTLDKVMAAMDEADPDDVDNAFAKYRKKTAKYKKFMQVLKSSNKELEKKFGKEALDDLGLKSKNMMDQFRAQANDIAKDQS
jgi:hypothetical protein